MPLTLKSTGGGSVTLDTPSTASTYTLTVPAITGTAVVTGSSGTVSQAMLAAGVAGNGPAFSANNSTAQSITQSVYTKLNADTEAFDTNSNFASSRFTPTVAGYYQINANAAINDVYSSGYFQILIYKNGSNYAPGNALPASSTGTVANSGASATLYLNGSTDYVEIYTFQTSASAKNIQLRDFSGGMIRGA